MRLLAVFSCMLLCAATTARAQTLTNTGGAVGGVAISTEGVLHYRQVAGAAGPASVAAKKGDLLYVSLPRALGEWKAALDAGKPVPDEVRYLRGLTRIDNVFVFPASHDLVLAGTAEPFKPTNPIEPRGTLTGRPVVQLEDLVVALRCVRAGTPRASRGARGASASAGGATGPGGRDFFGCSLENPANFQDAWNATLARYGKGPQSVLLAEMKKALGPQEVKLFGVPADSRVALAMLAADYHLKRIGLGLEPAPGIGNALGTETAAPRLWFEPAYDPLLMTADGSAYELRGPRLKVMVGAQQFSPGGATAAQVKFADEFSKKMPEIAGSVDAIADLQNVTDCFMVAALIRQDGLAEKAGVDWSWLLAAETAPAYRTASLTVPRTAETLVHISGNVIAQGGVALAYNALSGVQRQQGLQAKPARPEEKWFLVVPR